DMRQYDIVLVNLDPTIGSEIRKTRPCVVISPDEMNRHLYTIVVAPMTTNLKPYPTRVSVLHHGKMGMIVVDQIRTIDKSRVLNVTGKLNQKEILMLKQLIKATYVD
ncbi:MAG: type II toxin-antitoxin system PemK/MazF family toxin, partial [Bacteroidales bacterium]|nr:type II toxin-antitoxin system PemK/MazF family toxin [Bacteroidales bacterium]